MKIEVLGGYEPEMYRVVWDGVVLESNPAQIRHVVSYEPTLQINCIVPVNPTLTVDLKKLIGSEYTPNGCTFTVSNASKVEDKKLIQVVLLLLKNKQNTIIPNGQMSCFLY